MDGTSGNRTPLAAIIYMIHHVFLIPKLPQEDDFDPQHERVLLETTIDALRNFKAAAGYGQQGVIDSVCAMMENLRFVQDYSGAISQSKLESALQAPSNRSMSSLSWLEMCLSDH